MKRIVYHYCSLETFISIVTNKIIWLSHSRNTNDKTECLFALKHIINVLENYCHNKKYDKLLDEIIEDTKTIVDFPYIFCCSKEKDLLSQWNKYGDDGKGIAIGFDINCIPHIDILGKGDFTNNLIIDEINYNMKGIDEIIIKSINTIPLLRKRGLNNNKIKNNIIEFYKMLSTFIKDKGFKEEKEVRFAFKACYAHLLKSLNNDFNVNCSKHPQIRFRISDNNIISYFEQNFDANAIKEIVLGPKCKVNSNQLTLFLSEYLPEVRRKNKILKSNIPYT